MQKQVTAADMMAGRERRAERQRELLAQGGSLISFTLNIPGPLKLSPLWERGFREGCRLIEARLAQEKWPLKQHCRYREDTGYEAFWLLDAPADRLKRAMVAVEDGCSIGRLFDVDVLDADSGPVSRSDLQLPPRTCLICGQPAHVCGRSRAHGTDQLLARINGLLQYYFLQRQADRAASVSCRAMLTEVSVTPKPGLVDRHDPGSHRDMDFYTFIDSAAALTPWFRRFFLLGAELARNEAGPAFDRLRFPGMLAEADMFAATGGVNTHKGMIFSLALLNAAWGRLCGRGEEVTSSAVLDEAAALASAQMERELSEATAASSTAGMRLKALCGSGGVRAEAAAGFPTARQVGLPLLTAYMRLGMDRDRAGGLTLLALMAHSEDSNVFSRCGRVVQQELRRQMEKLSDRDEPLTPEELAELNKEFCRLNISPGGAADLLAITFFLYFLDKEGSEQ